jgi:four helix bundle protein
MRGETGSYRDLVVWQQAMDLAVAIYGATRSWPIEEVYGLTNQARRAATSIPSNIAEGYGRETRGSYLQFLRVAQGSLKELETHLLLSLRIGIATRETVEPPMQQTESVGKLLRLLLRKLACT